MIKLFRALISAILPVVVTDCAGRFVIRIKNACDWGGMLLVMAEEKLASTVMPRSSSPGRIFRPCSSKMSVSWFTTRRTVPDGVPHPAQFVYEIVTKTVPRSLETSSINAENTRKMLRSGLTGAERLSI